MLFLLLDQYLSDVIYLHIKDGCAHKCIANTTKTWWEYDLCLVVRGMKRSTKSHVFAL